MLWVEEDTDMSSLLQGNNETETSMEPLFNHLEEHHTELSQSCILFLLELVYFQPKSLRAYRNIATTLAQLKMRRIDHGSTISDQRRDACADVLEKLDRIIAKYGKESTNNINEDDDANAVSAENVHSVHSVDADGDSDDNNEDGVEKTEEMEDSFVAYNQSKYNANLSDGDNDGVDDEVKSNSGSEYNDSIDDDDEITVSKTEEVEDSFVAYNQSAYNTNPSEEVREEDEENKDLEDVSSIGDKTEDISDKAKKDEGGDYVSEFVSGLLEESVASCGKTEDSGTENESQRTTEVNDVPPEGESLAAEDASFDKTNEDDAESLTLGEKENESEVRNEEGESKKGGDENSKTWTLESTSKTLDPLETSEKNSEHEIDEKTDTDEEVEDIAPDSDGEDKGDEGNENGEEQEENIEKEDGSEGGRVEAMEEKTNGSEDEEDEYQNKEEENETKIDEEDEDLGTNATADDKLGEDIESEKEGISEEVKKGDDEEEEKEEEEEFEMDEQEDDQEGQDEGDGGEEELDREGVEEEDEEEEEEEKEEEVEEGEEEEAEEVEDEIEELKDDEEDEITDISEIRDETANEGDDQQSQLTENTSEQQDHQDVSNEAVDQTVDESIDVEEGHPQEDVEDSIEDKSSTMEIETADSTTGSKKSNASKNIDKNDDTQNNDSEDQQVDPSSEIESEVRGKGKDDSSVSVISKDKSGNTTGDENDGKTNDIDDSNNTEKVGKDAEDDKGLKCGRCGSSVGEGKADSSKKKMIKKTGENPKGDQKRVKATPTENEEKESTEKSEQDCSGTCCIKRKRTEKWVENITAYEDEIEEEECEENEDEEDDTLFDDEHNGEDDNEEDGEDEEGEEKEEHKDGSLASSARTEDRFHTKITNELGERYCIYKDIIRYSELTVYYRNLLQEDPPYAPRRYRLKVRQTTPENERKHRRAQTVNAVNFEIKVMEERLLDRKHKLEKVDQKIERILAKCQDRSDSTMQTIRSDEQEIKDNFEKYYFARKREADQKLKESGTEHLLIFTEDRTHTSEHRNAGMHYRGFKNKRSQTSPKEGYGQVEDEERG